MNEIPSKMHLSVEKALLLREIEDQVNTTEEQICIFFQKLTKQTICQFTKHGLMVQKKSCYRKCSLWNYALHLYFPFLSPPPD